MTRILPLTAAAALIALAGCSGTAQYPISHCDADTHYPVACQEIGASDPVKGENADFLNL